MVTKLAAAGGCRAFELVARAALATGLVQAGRVDEARAEVERCDELRGARNGWRSRAGDAALARASLDAATKGRDPVGAAEKLDAAADIYTRHGAGEVWHERVARER